MKSYTLGFTFLSFFLPHTLHGSSNSEQYYKAAARALIELIYGPQDPVQNPQYPEDYLENFLNYLEWTESRSSHVFNEFIRCSVHYLIHNAPPARNPGESRAGRNREKGLRSFFLTASDPVRMEALRKRLKQWMRDHSYFNPKCNYRSEGYRLLKETLKNEEKTRQLLERKLAEEAAATDMQWPCTIF